MSNKRQTIFDAVKAGFATVILGNGYSSNVGQKINEWQLTPIDANADPTLLPCVCLSDPDKQNLGPADGNENSSSRLFGINFEAALMLAESSSSPTAARQAEADVKTMIGKDQSWGLSGIKRTEPGDSQLLMNKDGTRVSGVLMRFTVKYVGRTWEA